jgi:oligopeptidase B
VGRPLHDPEVYAYMKSYTPYENVTGQAYPPIFALTGLNDTRVTYHERPSGWPGCGRRPRRPVPAQDRDGGGARRAHGRYDAWLEEALVLAWVIETASDQAQ